MNTEIIDTYKEMLDMIEKLRVRISFGSSKEKNLLYDRDFLIVKEFLYTLLIKEYENR